MKIKNLYVCLSASLALFAGHNVHGAVAFTITPSTVSNTYSGTITLQITGLTNTETVVVQRYLDLNTNGVIGGADTLVQQFSLQDGVASVIGGVTNRNVPGDFNSATGAITAVLNFQSGDFVQSLVGKYLYKLSSPAGHFVPITNNFSVTNFPFAQKITGNVVSNGTSTALANCIVLLFGPPRPGYDHPGNPLAGCTANTSGSYTMLAPTGTYTLVAFRSNYVSSFSNAPVVTLGSGQTVTTNLTVINATNSITGKLVDAANSAIGLPGIFMPAESSNHLVGISFSDSNGNFTLRVTASDWEMGSFTSGLLVHGYLGLNRGITTNSGASNVTLGFPKADALFYGNVRDNLGNAMPGIPVGASDNTSELYSTGTYTDANGDYFIGVLGLGSSDPWNVGVSSDNAPANFVFSRSFLNQMNGTNVAPGQAIRQDFTAILATNLIFGTVRDSTNGIIAGVGVSASANIAGTNYSTYTRTDTNGDFYLNVPDGLWSLTLDCYGGDSSLGHFGNYACPDAQYAPITGNNWTNVFIVQFCGGVSINATPLHVGEVGSFYSQSIHASDCSGVYNWSLVSGALPGNMNLDPSGNSYVLSGFPTNSGTFLFTVQVNDGAGAQTNKQFSLSISNHIRMITTTLPDGTNGLFYFQQLQAADGVPWVVGGQPYNWVITTGSPPANVTLTSDGDFSGLLTTSGTFNFGIRVSDSIGGLVDQPFSITVVSTNTYPPLTVGNVGGRIIVFWPASAGTNYVLQTTTNLITGPWVPATNGTPAYSIIFSNTSPAQFFRLQ